MKKFLYRILYTKEDDLDLSFLLCLLVTVAGVVAFMFEIWYGKRASIAAWSWMGTVFSAVIISAVPISRARLSAQSKVMGDVSKGIASSSAEGMSTDIQELSENGTKSI